MKIAFLGTESDAGKTHIAAAICTILSDKKPIPFKGQNMSLNAYVGEDNGEMAFAQSYQSFCSGRAPNSIMNPVLLKPVGQGKTEVIFMGRSLGIKTSYDYWRNIKKELREGVFELFARMMTEHPKSPIIVEGAGSCAEINMKDGDFTNLGLCKKFEIPFFVVADIERGGVFAKIIGTYQLLDRKEKELLCGFIINKMYGEKELLEDGINFIEKKTGKKVIGVISYSDSFVLPEEDSMAFRRIRTKRNQTNELDKKLRVRVTLTPYISNFSDFYPFALDDVDFSYAFDPAELEKADIIILPGSRNVFYDIKFLRETGFAKKIIEAYKEGVSVVGICGGYEMLFDEILDQYGVEFPDSVRKIQGLGMIKGKVKFEKEKKVYWETLNVNLDWFSGSIRGFNIRYGEAEQRIYGKENVFGTFLHNIFWDSKFRRAMYFWSSLKKKEKKKEIPETQDTTNAMREEARRWSEKIKSEIDVSLVESVMRVR